MKIKFRVFQFTTFNDYKNIIYSPLKKELDEFKKNCYDNNYSFDINRYVLDGIGDPKKAIAGIYFWTYDTEEVLDLIKWMRLYNANPDNPKKVKFYGLDVQDPQRAARVMLAYLKKVDPNLEEIVRPELGILEVPFSDPKGVGRRQLIPE